MMKRCLFWILAGVVATTTSFADSMKYYALEVRGGSRVFSLDPPVRKGRMFVFHRYPDGIYMSLSATEVEKVTALQAEPVPSAGELAPGQVVFVGPALSGPNFVAPKSGAPDVAVSYGSPDDYGYGYWGGGYVPPLPPGPPPPPPPRAPSRIGPNGFPIIAPPGTPGSVPLPIGPNGFPVLAPPPR
ncbi:MAG: hypothetical protein WAU32_14010 [Thermoanaerobaculia bacterium]